jgi:hypothetical protein
MPVPEQGRWLGQVVRGYLVLRDNQDERARQSG